MLTQERLKELLAYDPETGVFTWLVDRGKGHIGQVAGCLLEKRPGHVYWGIRIDGQRMSNVGRLAWLYMTGKLPEHQIDHRNGNPLDNRWSNLRLATRSQNQANKGISRNNKSGLKGIVFVAERRRWQANISVEGKAKYLGRYKTKEEAKAAYDMAVIAFHGEFGRLT